MRCCKKPIELFFTGLWILGLALVYGGALAENIVIKKTSSQLLEEGFQFSADFKIVLSPPVEEALRRGVTLNFISTFVITRSRPYWLDEEVAQIEQVSRLSYNVLTKQYRISRGSLFQGFKDLDSALRILGHQSTPPQSPELFNVTETYLQKISRGYLGDWIQKGVSHTVEASLRLDTSQLPKPLQVNALAGNDWNLASETYRWQFSPQLLGKEAGDEAP